MNNKRDHINQFFQNNTFAVVGVSSNPNKFGSILFKEFSKQGKTVVPINPSIKTFMNSECYPSLSDASTKPDAAIVTVSPAKALDISKDANQAGIRHIWFQKGAESTEAIRYCEENGINCISGECIYMYAEPVKSIHKFHRGLAKLFGKYHK